MVLFTTYLADIVDRARSPSEFVHGVLKKRVDGLEVGQYRVPQGQGERVGQALELVLDASLEREQAHGDAVNLFVVRRRSKAALWCKVSREKAGTIR